MLAQEVSRRERQQVDTKKFLIRNSYVLPIFRCVRIKRTESLGSHPFFSNISFLFAKNSSPYIYTDVRKRYHSSYPRDYQWPLYRKGSFVPVTRRVSIGPEKKVSKTYIFIWSSMGTSEKSWRSRRRLNKRSSPSNPRRVCSGLA